MDQVCRTAVEVWLRRDPLGEDESVLVFEGEMLKAAWEELNSGKSKSPMVRLISPKVRVVGQLALVNERPGPPMGMLVANLDEKTLGFSIYNEQGRYEPVGYYDMRAARMDIVPSKKDESKYWSPLLSLLLVCLRFSNTPSFTEHRMLPRPMRRTLDRELKTNTSERVRVVSWNLTKPKLKAGETVGSGRHMPLHFTRGHWRQCAGHLDRAELHDDGIHRMWIEGFWSGHPAYGVVRSVHVPKM